MAGLSAGSVVLCTVLAGCAPTPLAKPATALSSALAPVVDQSAAAYRDAVALDNLREDYEAVVAYQNKDATFNPRNTPVLLTEKDIQARLAVLAALPGLLSVADRDHQGTRLAGARCCFKVRRKQLDFARQQPCAID